MFLVNKNRKVIIRILSGLVVLFLFHSYLPVHADEDKKTRRNPSQAQYTAEGVEGCIKCHGGVLMTQMAKTVHGNKDNPHTPYAAHGCESCHGPGSLHVSRARGGIGFPALMAFRQWESTEQHNEACMSCHGKYLGKRLGMKWNGSIHQLRGMSCVYCHRAHSASDKMKDQELQRERCSKCHSRKIEQHDDFASAGIVFERLTCSTCHDVHELVVRAAGH